MADEKVSIVLGLGKTGYACARFLANQGIPVTVMDTRDEPPEYYHLREQFPEIKIFLGDFDEAYILQAKEVIVSPGLYLAEPTLNKSQNHNLPKSKIELLLQKCRDKGISVIGDIELFSRYVKADIIGITGSNGKSTVTSLVGEMAEKSGLKAYVGGNLGTPALDLLALEDLEKPDLYILELSNVQLELTQNLHCSVACILNITPDHMDRYDNLEEYIASKQRIYQHCDTVVLNRDDKNTWPDESCEGDEFSFGSEDPQEGEFGLRLLENTAHFAFGAENLMSVDSLRVRGRHNWLNVLAALAIGYAADFPLDTMLCAISEFTGLPHRCQWVAEADGIAWFNDSKGTNIGATIAAIEGLGSDITGKVILIAGGLAKEADFTDLSPVARQYCRTAILMGQDANLLERALIDDVELLQADSMQEAVWAASQQAQAGDIVLLSPACASFDMYQSFAKRGEDYCHLVREFLNER